MFSVTVNGPELEGICESLNALAKFDKQKLLNYMGMEAVDVDVHDAFENEANPVTGEKWVPSKRAIEKNGKTLQDERHLIKNINHKITGESSVAVGTSVVYADKHQNGDETLIARPFLGVRRDFQERVMNDPVVRRMFRL